MWNYVPGRRAADVNLDAAPYGFKVTGDAAWDSSRATGQCSATKATEL